MTNQDENREFCLSLEQAEYLEMLASKDSSIRGLVRLRYDPRGPISISLGSGQVRDLRDRLMNRMDVVGYDEAYSPNREGRLLEGLIDKFFVP